MAHAGLAWLTIWKLLALDELELQQADLVAANLAVARENPALRKLNIEHDFEIVHGWANRFAHLGGTPPRPSKVMVFPADRTGPQSTKQ